MNTQNVVRFRIIWLLYPENESRFHHSSNMNLQNVMRFLVIRFLYPENVPRFRHSSSLKWYSVGRIHLASTFFSCLDTRKEGKRKSRPLPRPGKLARYMMKIKNVVRFQIIRSLYPENVSRFAHSPSLGWHPVGRMQYASTWNHKKSTRFPVTR